MKIIFSILELSRAKKLKSPEILENTALLWVDTRKLFLWNNIILTLSRRRSLSYRNQSIDLLRKSMDWFLYGNGHHHERVNHFPLRRKGSVLPYPFPDSLGFFCIPGNFFRFVWYIFHEKFMRIWKETYLKLCQAFMMEVSCENSYGF